MKMRKILGKTLMVAAVLTFAVFMGSTFAQFGGTTDQGAGFGLAGGATGWEFSLMKVVKGFINWILGLLSLIALAMALFGGFKMVTAAGDDGKYKEGFKVLKQAAIGLVVVWLSWIIVSSIFWIINQAWTGTIAAQ